MHIVQYCFNIACFSAALGMTSFWIYKYFKDEDLSQVDFKPFDELASSAQITMKEDSLFCKSSNAETSIEFA